MSYKIKYQHLVYNRFTESLRFCLDEGVNLRRWIWRDLSGLCVDERVVWINGWMVRFEWIWGDWLWKFGIDL